MEATQQPNSTIPMYAPRRKKISRSRNGCAVCKSKRLKCDEARPSCSRCERLGITCPGYQTSLRWAISPRTIDEKTGARASSRSGTSPGWTATPNNAEIQWPTDDVANLYSSEFSEQFDLRAAETGDITAQDDGSPGMSFPFEELLGGMDFQPAQMSSPSVCLTDQERNEEESWQDTLLTVSRSQPNFPARPGPLSQAHLDRPLARALQDHTSTLVEYYFKEVCGMMSCYDSQLNPYRTTIKNNWSASMSLYYTTQSMAAACLSEISPGLSSVGRQLCDQTAISLYKEFEGPRVETSSLLSLVMLGMSLSWHDPSNLGQSEFDMLVRLVQSTENIQHDLTIAERQQRFFFYNSLIYWQMLLAFVTDIEPNLQTTSHAQQELRPQPQPSQFSGMELREQRMPHPQTGIGIEVQKLLAQVGSLVRKERKRIRSRRFTSRNDIDEANKAILEAERLHAELCAVELPQESSIVDSGDDMTPADHLLKVAEAYRCTGLLQLYRNFPDLLSPYISQYDSTGSSTAINPRPSSSAGMPRDAWLVGLALHILDLIQDIPVSSRSRSIQPLLLVSTCSDLVLGHGGCSLAGMRRAPVASIASSPRFRTAATDLDILLARRSVISRLSAFEHILAAKPIRRMLLLVKETWARMEDEQDVYWMDVMMDKGYETLMG